jgi:hypothetical protein
MLGYHYDRNFGWVYVSTIYTNGEWVRYLGNGGNLFQTGRRFWRPLSNVGIHVDRRLPQHIRLGGDLALRIVRRHHFRCWQCTLYHATQHRLYHDDGYVLSLTSTTLERVPYLTEEEVELTAVGL